MVHTPQQQLAVMRIIQRLKKEQEEEVEEEESRRGTVFFYLFVYWFKSWSFTLNHILSLFIVGVEATAIIELVWPVSVLAEVRSLNFPLVETMSVRRALVDCVVLSLQDTCVLYPCCKDCFSRIDVEQQDKTRYESKQASNEPIRVISNGETLQQKMQWCYPDKMHVITFMCASRQPIADADVSGVGTAVWETWLVTDTVCPWGWPMTDAYLE